MKTTIKTTELRHGWLSVGRSARAVRQPRVAPATEPRYFSTDPAFGDFNLPLGDTGSTVANSSAEDAEDLACLLDAIDADDFESYSDFRRDELGL